MSFDARLPSTLHESRAQELRLLSSGSSAWTLVGLSTALALPSMLTTGWLSIANQSLIAMIGAMALNLLMGTTGQISLGHAGFIAAGAFTSAALVTHIEAPFALSLVAAAMVGEVIGVLVGFPALRLKGLYLAVSTLAAHFVIIAGLGQYQSWLSYGAGFQMPPPSCSAWLSAPSAAGIISCCRPRCSCCWSISTGYVRRSGARGWPSTIATSRPRRSGINTAHLKLLAFSASTAVTSFAGALWAYHTARRWKRSTST